MRKHGILERRNEVGDFVAIIFPLNKDEKNRLQNMVKKISTVAQNSSSSELSTRFAVTAGGATDHIWNERTIKNDAPTKLGTEKVGRPH
jgi:hypothetical protein